jgi:hypothetical protein
MRTVDTVVIKKILKRGLTLIKRKGCSYHLIQKHIESPSKESTEFSQLKEMIADFSQH